MENIGNNKQNENHQPSNNEIDIKNALVAAKKATLETLFQQNEQIKEEKCSLTLITSLMHDVQSLSEILNPIDNISIIHLLTKPFRITKEDQYYAKSQSSEIKIPLGKYSTLAKIKIENYLKENNDLAIELFNGHCIYVYSDKLYMITLNYKDKVWSAINPVANINLTLGSNPFNAPNIIENYLISITT